MPRYIYIYIHICPQHNSSKRIRQTEYLHHSACLCVICQHSKKTQNNQQNGGSLGGYVYTYLKHIWVIWHVIDYSYIWLYYKYLQVIWYYKHIQSPPWAFFGADHNRHETAWVCLGVLFCLSKRYLRTKGSLLSAQSVDTCTSIVAANVTARNCHSSLLQLNSLR